MTRPARGVKGTLMNWVAGKLVVRGTRLAVEFIIGLLGQGWTKVYPQPSLRSD